MKKCNGSFTLEATIVISSILIILCAVLYAFMLLYQHAIISRAASNAATEGAKVWVSAKQSGNMWRLKEFKTITSGDKIKSIKAVAQEDLKKGVMNCEGDDIKVTFKNSWGMRTINVEIKQDINVPFAGVAQFFNGGKPLELKATASANVAEPTEYIRNIDYGVEWITVLGEWVGGKIGDAVKGIDGMNKIKALFGL